METQPQATSYVPQPRVHYPTSKVDGHISHQECPGQIFFPTLLRGNPCFVNSVAGTKCRAMTW
jgi:hypothetical protein